MTIDVGNIAFVTAISTLCITCLVLIVVLLLVFWTMAKMRRYYMQCIEDMARVNNYLRRPSPSPPTPASREAEDWATRRRIDALRRVAAGQSAQPDTQQGVPGGPKVKMPGATFTAGV